MRRRFRFHIYECKKGHTQECLVEDSHIFDKRKCEVKGCRSRAELKSLCEARRNALPQATIVFEGMENGKKVRLYPGRSDHPTPEGFVRREIQGMGEIRKFEREVRREMNEKAEKRKTLSDELFKAAQKQRHSDLRGLANQMDSFHRGLAEEAMRSENEGYSKQYDSDFHIGAYE